ncbi:aconitate hydratase [Cystobacter fuscus]|uniref:Aconitate hydratase A n=1 Tax=Cystobacter fuscus TaxID=43 RepID=A0A250J6Q1_9BACT|nr:aconitate hydratase AcnA [Cystobacter fuscus]ATB39177.1 aconitate hydratase [Cystobacter fuscus]
MTLHSVSPTLVLDVPGRPSCIDVAAAVGAVFRQMPVVHRILLENIVRTQPPEDARTAVAHFAAWQEHGRSDEEIRFLPNRILMHDTTCGPALTDIAAMRDVVASKGVDPARLNPVLPVATSTDHSVAVDFFGREDALERNMAREMERNAERYRFMKWASRTVTGFRVFPPGSGIMHTINMERLATVTETAPGHDGSLTCFPDALVGTDSHTPMVNAMGVLAWGVGGIEAEGVMFGVPVSIRLPDVIGVRLTGRLPDGVFATDLALHVTHRLREMKVAGEFVEYFGPGVSTLTVGQRSVVANMAPEYGATTGFFPVDEHTLDYLRLTGRSNAQVALVAAQTRAQELWFEPEARPRYTRLLEVDLGQLRPSLTGPKRPQDLLATAEVPAVLAPALAGVREGPLPPDALAIAAITSCTNTTDPGLLVAAGLVARKARALGLRTPHWVKTSMTPGSPATARRLARVGLLEALEALGFGVVGHGCATCIGNSGPLSAPVVEAIEQQGLKPIAVLSGNRNFPGRVHTQVDNALLASPPLVVAYALAGHAAMDIAHDPITTDASGRPVTLHELWPGAAEVEQLTREAWAPGDMDQAYGAAEASRVWQQLSAPGTPLFPWDPASTYLRPPPFVAFAEPRGDAGALLMHPIMVVGDDITTDHISPAGAIPASSDAGRWLIEQGEDPTDLNVYSSRRGNWEVMLRGLFTNRSVINHLGDELRAGASVFAATGERLPVWQVAAHYHELGQPVCIVAGERYGTGSSRDWAAKGVQLLGAKVLFANSLERIHRSNLIGMGVLPLRLPEGWRPEALGLRPGDVLEVDWAPEAWAPHLEITTTLRRADGRIERGTAQAFIETKAEADLLRAGGMIANILARTVAGRT